MKSFINILICVLFIFSHQIFSQEINSDKVKITLQAEKLEWKSNENIKISLKLENLTDNELLIEEANFDFQVVDIQDNYIPTFGKIYYHSPVNLEKRKTTKLKFRKQDGLKVGVFERQKLKLNKNEVKKFVIELSNLKWDGNLSSFYPDKDFYKIVKKGNYKLVFSVSCENCYSLKSDEIKFSVI